MLIAPSQEIGGQIGDKKVTFNEEIASKQFYTVDCLDGTVSER